MIIKSSDDSRLVRKTTYSNAYDVVLDRDVEIKEGVNYIDLNISVQLLKGVCIQVMTRSSNMKKGIIMPSTLVDSDYTGSIHAILFATNSLTLHKGDRICQFLVTESISVDNWKVENKERGSNGIGSTK